MVTFAERSSSILVAERWRRAGSADTPTRLLSERGSGAIRISVVWSWVIAAAVVVQVFLAGLYVFGSASIEAHVLNGSFLLFATLLGGIVALVARVPGRVAGAHWGLFGLVVVQVILIEVGTAAGVPEIKAFHVVNALAIFGLSSVLALRSRASFAAPERAAPGAGASAGAGAGAIPRAAAR